MLQLRQLDLQLPFARARTLGKDVQNQRRAVKNLAVKSPFQVSTLRGGEFIVKDHRVDIRPLAVPGKLLGLAFTDISGRARSGQLLNPVADNLASRRNS